MVAPQECSRSKVLPSSHSNVRASGRLSLSAPPLHPRKRCPPLDFLRCTSHPEMIRLMAALFIKLIRCLAVFPLLSWNRSSVRSGVLSWSPWCVVGRLARCPRQTDRQIPLLRNAFCGGMGGGRKRKGGVWPNSEAAVGLQPTPGLRGRMTRGSGARKAVRPPSSAAAFGMIVSSLQARWLLGATGKSRVASPKGSGWPLGDGVQKASADCASVPPKVSGPRGGAACWVSEGHCRAPRARRGETEANHIIAGPKGQTRSHRRKHDRQERVSERNTRGDGNRDARRGETERQRGPGLAAGGRLLPA